MKTWQDLSELVPPARDGHTPAGTYANNPIYDEIFGMAQGAEAQRVAGSLFGSMQQVSIHEQAISSLGRGYVGSAYHVWSDHVRCGNVRCWLLCLDATNSASSVLVNTDAG